MEEKVIEIVVSVALVVVFAFSCKKILTVLYNEGVSVSVIKKVDKLLKGIEAIVAILALYIIFFA